MPDERTKNREKLQRLLRDLFQFDAADLDFGIYRILNEKRAEIECFIEEDLLDAVEEGLAGFHAAERDDLEKKLAEKKQQLGDAAFDETGAVLEQFQGINVAQEYMQLRRQLRQLDVAEETEARIFNDLYRFFARYYDNGDFLTERRYSSREPKFAVPYNGEEVLLHWANRDQYYVKTSERFTDYRFSAGDHMVWFKLGHAQEPTDNVKSDTRYFVLRSGDPLEYDSETKTLTVYMEYRPLSEAEDERYLSVYNAQQTRKSDRRKTLDRSVLVVALEAEIMDHLDVAEVKHALARPRSPADSSNRTELGYHLNRYTARHTMDYFVHKQLGDFLRRELDFFLKNEVLEVDDFLEDTSGDSWQHVLSRARTVREIAEKIIAFLAQIEDFQKRLFEKKKFVVQTDYCITLDRVPAEFYPEVLANGEQLAEWRRLYAVKEWEEDLFWNGDVDERFLKNHPYIMVDTGFFDDDFKRRLLAAFEDLDAAIDGVLVHGENFQALNLLETKYGGRVQCIYIDPPYNTGNDDFLYKDNYQHSSWLSMLQDRVALGRSLLSASGVFFSHIDDNELFRYQQMLETLFGVENFISAMPWIKRYAPPPDTSDIGYVHEMLVAFQASAAFQRNLLPLTDEQKSRYKNLDDDPRGPWKAADYTCRYTADERPNLYYPITNPNTGEEVWPKRSRVWAFSKEEHQKNVRENRIWWGVDGTNSVPALKNFLDKIQQGKMPTSVLHYEEVGHTDEAAKELRSFFPELKMTPKPSRLGKHLLMIGANPDSLVIDFFAGSGTTAHAVLDLNREDGGNRKYILVEMGEYFDTVLKPRIQKLVFSANWKNGVPQDRDGVSHMFKYQRLESYEDALNNIRVQQPAEQQLPLLYEDLDDYMLSYMLDFETRDSPTLLTEEAFEWPFDYKLAIQQGHESPEPTNVDLVETFHYLLGMQVRRLERHEHQGRTYVVSRGEVRTEHGIETVAVIWRRTIDPDLDLEQEADWVHSTLLPEAVDRVYVNGESFIENAEPLEFTFRDRMEAG